LPDLKKLIENRSAVSEVMGEILMTTIAILLVSVISIFIFTYDGADDVPHTQVKEWIDADTDKIYLEHGGGKFLETEAFEIVATINGERYVYTSSKIYAELGNQSSWQLGDTIEIDASDEWGIDIRDEDSVKVFLIDKTSRQVIQYLTLSLGESENSNWGTPQGTVTDTSSGGAATLLDVQEKGDGLHTSYSPSTSAIDPSIYEEFDFDMNPAFWGFGPGENVTAATLKIVYRVNTSSCEQIELKVWDAEPTGTWHNESLPEYGSFTAEELDLSGYINSTDDLAGFKVRILASEYANASAKRLNVDYVALQAI